MPRKVKPARTELSRVRAVNSGVTLFELLTSLLIVAILVTIAIPNYEAFIARAKRAEAASLLLDIAMNQERFYLSSNRYGTLLELGYPDPLLTRQRSYRINIETRSTQRFVATATYSRADNEQERCKSLSIDSKGVRKSTGSARDCWAGKL